MLNHQDSSHPTYDLSKPTQSSKGSKSSNSESISGRTKESHPQLSGGFSHFTSIQLPPTPPTLLPSSASPSHFDPPSAVTASHLAPPPGYHVAACQVCSEVILTSKASGGQHTCCPLRGEFGVPGVKGKAPAMPSLYYFDDDPALRVCDCMPRAAKPSDAPFLFCPGCKTKGSKPVAHPAEQAFVTRNKGELPPWKRPSAAQA